MTAPRLVLRGDASHRLGSGHVLRLAALAEAAVDVGGTATVIVGGEPGPSLALLAERGLSAVAADGAAGSDHDRAHTATVARAAGATALVLDGPGFGIADVEHAARAGIRTVSVDDLGVAPLPTTTVINHNLGAEALAAHYPAASVRLLGRRFALLRREFRRQPAGGRPLSSRVDRVLVTMGGSDPAGATARVLSAMPAGSFEVVVVLGPGFRGDDALTAGLAATEARGHRVALAYSPADLPSLMAGCDLAISAAGGTLAELAYLGRPTLAVAIAPDQVANARRHVAAGLAAGGWPLSAVTDAALSAEIDDLVRDPVRRHELGLAAAAAVDGRGAERVVLQLAA